MPYPDLNTTKLLIMLKVVFEYTESGYRVKKGDCVMIREGSLKLSVIARYHFLPRQQNGGKKIVLQTEEIKQTGGGA